MGSSHRRLATTIIAGLFVASACTAAASPAPDLTPTASPSITLAAAAASPTAMASPSPSATPQPTPEPTPAPVPPKPTNVKFDQRMSDPGPDGEITQTVTWGAPRSEGVEIRVFGVTECIAEPANPSPGTSGPCLVVQTPLPPSVRTLLATARASDGVVSWSWTDLIADCGEPLLGHDPAGPRYYAVVLAAYSASSQSIFAIAEPGEWWRAAEGPGDVVC